MKGRRFRLIHTYGGEWELTVSLAPDSVQAAKNLVNEQQDRDYDITIKVYRERRSLTANAYFHKLCNLIATKLNASDETIKKHLVNSYGAVAEWDGVPAEIRIPKTADPTDYYPYCVWLKSDGDRNVFLLKKQTHCMTSAELSHVIDGAQDEARALGIETLSDDELRRLYAQEYKSVRDPEKRENSRI